MPSTFSWLDFSDEQRQKTMDIIALFRESDTVDELGIGVVRDTFSDLLFPGTSTIQTRAKYFLFIPWIYRDLERRKVPSNKINTRARQMEIQLIYGLLDGGETDGVIGSLSKKDLQRIPSRIYWNGLAIWGIRKFSGGIGQYNRSLDSYYQSMRSKRKNDDGDLIVGGLRANWHAGLPEPPDDFPRKATLKINRQQALYLQERLLTSVGQSLLTYLVDQQKIIPESFFPWSISLTQDLPEPVKTWMGHGRNFSEMIWGAPLLYNLMLAEMIGDVSLVERYHSRLSDWANQMRNRWEVFETWERKDFWEIVEGSKGAVPTFTKGFIDEWWGMALADPEGIMRNNKARDLILNREKMLKRGQARLFSQRARELWGGAAGTTQIDYRWKNGARQIINDIIEGLIE